jgi:putative protease
LKLKEIRKINRSTVKIFHPVSNIESGDKVFLVGLGDIKFQSKFALEGKKLTLQMPAKTKTHILSRIGSHKIPKHNELFIRIDSPDWLRKIYFDKIDNLILKFTKNDWQKINLKIPFIRKNLKKIIIQFPKFIAENDLNFYHSLTKTFVRNNIKNFMLGHISQIQFFSHFHNLNLFASGNIYSLNDAAIQLLKETKISKYIYPFENEFSNLITGKDRKGIVPLFFLPELFYSRMPVIDLPSDFRDRDNKYHKVVRDGITCILPELPVSLLQYKNKLHQKGFRRFLIDFSYQKPSQNSFNRLLKKFHASEAEQPATAFNFKLGLK